MAWSRRSLWVSSLGLVAGASVVVPSITTDAAARAHGEVVVVNVGSTPLRVRVSQAGEGRFCTAPSHQLYVGTIKPGETTTVATADECVCVMQTYGDAPNAVWSSAAKFCRPQVCSGAGRTQTCVPSGDGTIRIGVDAMGK